MGDVYLKWYERLPCKDGKRKAFLINYEWFNFTGRKQTKLAVKPGFEPMQRTETAQKSHRTCHQKGSLLPKSVNLVLRVEVP